MADNLPDLSSPSQDKNLVAYSKNSLFFKKFSIGITIALIVLSFLILILNFFHVFNLSKLSPIFNFLPIKQSNIDKVDLIINSVNNPNPKLITKYHVNEGVLGGAQERIINGLKTNIPRLQPFKGLNDLKKAITLNNNKEAQAIIIEVITRSILERSLSGDKENIDSDLVKLTPEQLKDIDPEGVIPQLRAKAPNDGRVSVVWKPLLKTLLQFYKQLNKS